MTRWPALANSAETQKAVFSRASFVTVTTSGGNVVRAWTGFGYLNDGVNTYTGFGGLGKIEAIKEESDLFPRGLRLLVSGLPNSFNALFTELTSERLFNQEVTVSAGFVNEQRALVSSLSERYYGRVGAIDGAVNDPDRGTYFELTVGSPLRAPPKYDMYSDEGHRATAAGSGDYIFKFLKTIATAPPAPWGDKTVGPSGGPGGSGAGYWLVVRGRRVWIPGG